MQIQQSFSEYYGTKESNNKSKNETISGNGDYYIHNAIFSFHYRKTAIYLNSSSKVLLETCAFYNNSSTESGGSFYIKYSDCILVHICILLSSVDSSHSGGCGYSINPYLGSNSKNYAFESSVSQCSGYFASFYHFFGDIKVSNMNTSYHEINQYAAYVIAYPKGTGIINFTTASNTSSTKYAGIRNSGNFNFTKCNYLNNEYTGSDNAIIFCSSSSKYSSCSFIGNKGNYLFNKKPTIDNCYFNNNVVNQTISNNADTFDSIEPLDSFISHYSTYCFATKAEENKDDSYKNIKKKN
ncbi:hypothetical protein TVAG_151520 [Trichomonas vaginalis G3]|uniref:Right handed beta helix domain-containing protein n=1 Tax=Trichomonas vaginalis (strain ATCC PRA-98 / G3) TaxID=412133 RepID=A2G6R1_TRIV3|nr:pectin lyase-like family [Trichomonas vaginalis G3]EAX87161.1 hypothetical protein TVAG_151520 [Trichomonas vaginalis G3]KAI5512085.1 pectin lyase-like family [Trichomonas vaginalis G3]|eukprot:XP_001300091.1 hypothetical protein [Trichomonas vaginalis G3]